MTLTERIARTCRHDRMTRFGLTLHCDACGRAVDWNGSRYVLAPVTADSPSPFARRARAGKLPASDRTAGR